MGGTASVYGLPPRRPGILHPACPHPEKSQRRGNRDRLVALPLHLRLCLRSGTLPFTQIKKLEKIKLYMPLGFLVLDLVVLINGLA